MRRAVEHALADLDARGMLGVEALAPAQVEQPGFEPPLLFGQRAAAGRQLQVLQAEFVDRGGALIDQVARSGATRRPRRRTAPSGSGWNRRSSRCRRSSASRARTIGCDRALEHDDDVGRARRRAAAGIEDRAEQQQLGAGEAVADLDLARRDIGHQHRLGRRRSAASDSASSSERGRPRRHRYSIV